MAQSGHLEHHGDVDVGGQSPFALFPQDVTDECLHDAGDDDRTRTAAEGGSGNIGESCVLFVVLFILIVFVCGLHAGRVSCFVIRSYIPGWNAPRNLRVVVVFGPLCVNPTYHIVHMLAGTMAL